MTLKSKTVKRGGGNNSSKIKRNRSYSGYDIENQLNYAIHSLDREPLKEISLNQKVNKTRKRPSTFKKYIKRITEDNYKMHNFYSDEDSKGSPNSMSSKDSINSNLSKNSKNSKTSKKRATTRKSKKYSSKK